VKAAQNTATDAALPILLRSFRLPAFVREYARIGERAAAEGLSHPEYLLALAEVEAAERDARRTARRLEESRLPREKTLGNYDLERLPEGLEVTQQTLADVGLIHKRKGPAKVLANGDLSRAVTVRGIKMSAGARTKIEAAGGRVEE